MGISHYLAMTAAEITAADKPADPLAYMACHFAPYGNGLTGLPQALPPGAMVILNDRIPYFGQDVSVVADQLNQLTERFSADCILLDFQRADTPELLCRQLCESLHCPVGISRRFARDPCFPIFLPPVPPDVSPEAYLASWTGREIWLETALETVRITVDAAGSKVTPLPYSQPDSCCFSEEDLHCRYRIEVYDDRAEFTLSRAPEDIPQILEAAARLGVTKAVGLYQEMKKLPV